MCYYCRIWEISIYVKYLPRKILQFWSFEISEFEILKFIVGKYTYILLQTLNESIVIDCISQTWIAWSWPKIWEINLFLYSTAQSTRREIS